MPELGLSSTYDYSTATSNRKKSIFLVIGVTTGVTGDENHGDKQPEPISGVSITSVTDEWVRYGCGRNDRFRNPRVAGSFK